MSGPPPPGLQQERTTLSWRRSLLAFCVVAVLVVRAGLVTATPSVVALALVGIGTALWIVVLTLRGSRWGMSSPVDPEFRVLRGGAVPLAVVGVAAVLCVAVVLLSVRG